MSYHDDYFAAQGLPLLFEQQGEAITITPPEGDAVNLTAIVGAETQLESEESTTRRRKYTRVVTITTDAAGTFGGVAVPTTAYRATVGGKEYEVDQVSTKEAGFATLTLVREASMERSRPGFRKRPA